MKQTWHENSTESNHFTATFFVVIAQKHQYQQLMFTKVRVNCNGGLPLHVPNFWNISKSTQIWMRLLQLAQILLGLMEFFQMIIIYANLNEPLLIYPVGSNCNRVWIKLFHSPKFDWGCWNYPKVSNCIQILMRRLYITQIGMKLFAVTQNELNRST